MKVVTCTRECVAFHYYKIHLIAFYWNAFTEVEQCIILTLQNTVHRVPQDDGLRSFTAARKWKEMVVASFVPQLTPSSLDLSSLWLSKSSKRPKFFTPWRPIILHKHFEFSLHSLRFWAFVPVYKVLFLRIECRLMLINADWCWFCSAVCSIWTRWLKWWPPTPKEVKKWQELREVWEVKASHGFGPQPPPAAAAGAVCTNCTNCTNEKLKIINQHEHQLGWCSHQDHSSILKVCIFPHIKTATLWRVQSYEEGLKWVRCSTQCCNPHCSVACLP